MREHREALCRKLLREEKQMNDHVRAFLSDSLTAIDFNAMKYDLLVVLSVQFVLVFVFLLVVLEVTMHCYSICLTCQWKLGLCLQYYIRPITHYFDICQYV